MVARLRTAELSEFSFYINKSFRFYPDLGHELELRRGLYFDNCHGKCQPIGKHLKNQQCKIENIFFNTQKQLFLLGTVSVLGREEGYPIKYGLSPRKFPRAQPEGTSEGSGHVS